MKNLIFHFLLLLNNKFHGILLCVLPHFDPLFKKLSWIKNSNTLPEKRDQEQNKNKNEMSEF